MSANWWEYPTNGNATRSKDDRVIVGCGIGRHYRRLLASTINHCTVHCPEAWKLWYDELPDGCPPHERHQYAFKISALREAIGNAGFRYVMWMDTKFQPIASLDPLWAYVQENGWYVPAQGDSKLGTWTTDAALVQYGISRDAAMDIDLVFSGIVALEIRHPLGRNIWERWQALIGTFPGPHYNRPGLAEMEQHGMKWRGHCSNDPRCEGHRHDESALSFVLHSLGLKPIRDKFICLHDPEHGIIGDHVPDFDVVRMRERCVELARLRRELFGNPQQEMEIMNLCR